MGFHFGSSDRGFSLIELLTAMTVFTVGLLAVASMQLTAIRANASAHSLTTVSALAEGVLEEILALAGDDPLFASDRSMIPWADYDATGRSIEEAPGVYRSACSIDANYGIPGLTRVEVWVTSTGTAQRSQILVGFKRLP